MAKKISTKRNILLSALKLFNADGLVNVRLQHIADEAFISIGNLAYHYATKEVIVWNLYEELMHEQRQLLAEYRIVPLFDNINLLLRRTYQLQRKYRFFYLDTLEIIRAYPKIKLAHQEFISWQMNQLSSLLDFNVARGALLRPEDNKVFERLAVQLWMTIDYWMIEQLVRGENPENELQYLNDIWNLLLPHFSHMGQQEYRQMQEMPDDLIF